MDKTLYDLMDWAGIEEIVYSEAANPHRMLGAHMTPEGMLVQAFIPTARDITVKLSATGKQYQMEMADETGFFAALIPRKTLADYTLLVFYDNGTLSEIHDPYSFAPQFTESDLKKFEAGVHYSIYNKMGAHPMTVKGVSGVYFAVWAPEAMRVSVVGDFNLWDGRRSQMRRLGDSGVFEIFIPELKKGAVYKYEIKFKNGDPALKADPYANYAELRPNTASIVWDLDEYKWNDQDWMKKRAALDTKTAPMSIYEVHLGSWMRKPTEVDKRGREIVGSEFYNYREIAVKLAEYVKEMGYTHVELLPVMEHPLDASWGYQVTGYYAPTSRFGTPDDFMYFMDYLHGQGIGVILDWVPAHFPRDAWGMAQFDGSCLYEHKDPRQGAHPHWGTLIYNYGRPGVSNFLIANAMFWADRYHADGIRFDAVASMLYLDYGKNPGEWIANMYGGHENLEAVEFLKHLNSVFRGRKDGAILIAEESTAWPKVTGDVKNGGLGFDYKWNMGWMNDFLGYMEQDPYFRCHHYNELTFSMIYAYSENFVLVFSHDEVVHGKGSLVNKMPGQTFEDKFANLRAAYGFMMGHPGKKLLFMGQDFAQMDEWNENASIEWELLQYPIHSQMKEYVKELNHLYTSHPALYQKDYQTEGFEWINCMDAADNIIAFLRRGADETLLFVCNFAPQLHEKLMVGGHENLEAVEFLKHLNSVFRGRKDGAILIAEESTAWPKVTGDVKNGGLGFDYKWNMGWMNDFLGYMEQDPYFRCHHYNELTFSMIYAYSENFVLVFSHDEVVHGKGSLVNKMPGQTFEDKFANLRAAYGFMMGHPGKKLLFMGQDFAQMDEWNENASIEWELLQYPIHSQMKEYVKELNHLYTSHPALYQKDYQTEGFEWINCMDAADNIIAFLRRGADETLLFVCNFAPQLHEKLMVGVPFKGKYKEIFNSDAEKFGGSGKVNPRMKSSKAEECDGKENSITIQLAPLGISVFSCTPTEPEKKEKPAKTKKTTHSTKSVKEKAEKPAEKPAKRNAPAKKAEADLQSMMAEAAAVFNGKAGETAAAAAERLAGISDKLAEAKAGLSSKIISLSSIARRQAGLEEGLDKKVGKE